MTQNSRQEDARRREEMAAAALRHESVAAQVLVDEFVATAAERGLRPEPLQALLINGKRVKSDQVGFYINKSKTLAITPDGRFFKLMTTGGAMARFTGVTLQPSPPPMVISRGGRDGETGDLVDFLERTLADYA
ncbi:MAG: hypothetical protein WAS07_14175 [Micropruina sp.]|nr:hypothetical protein [Micropruina sp.]